MASPNEFQPTRYVIITPVRDEALHIEETISNVVCQTIRPVEWVIVDDGSTDGTGAVVHRHTEEFPWISFIQRSNRGYRDADVGAIGAFLDGYRALKTNDWEFLVNLDADMSLEPEYFKRCFEEFMADHALGVGGGTLYHMNEAGEPIVEMCPRFHVRGATKILRRSCWDASGGINEIVPAWDTYLDVKAFMAGWKVRTFPHIRAHHRRPTGAAGGGAGWHDAVKNGRSDYFLGYHPLFMLIKCIRRVFVKPYLLCGVAHLWGFSSGYLMRRRTADKAITRFVRKQQMRRLFFQESVWK